MTSLQKQISPPPPDDYTEEEIENAYRILYDSGEMEDIFIGVLDKVWGKITTIRDQNQNSWLFKAQGIIHEAMKNPESLLRKPKSPKKKKKKQESNS